ncbi:MAG: phospho-sugar mutase [Defluviitaleaceae bacterium]|nr:phospho-sugar mutase [Defluviitaleaceae bacterium]
MDYIKRYESWLGDSFFDEETRSELALLRDNFSEIEERFHKDLEFGTGGLRGIIGAGTNRMNIYTVRKATQGFANYLKKEIKDKELGVLFAYDSRRFSKVFAEEAALVMCGNGIKAYIYDSLRSTPQLSFGVRYLGLSGGVVITASHNPPEYNGYKVYGSDGGQVPFPKDIEIIEEVNRVDSWEKVSIADKDKAVKDGMLVYTGSEVDEAYYNAVLNQSVNKNAVKELGDSLNIVFTPLHGTGNLPVREVLRLAGFKNVHIVKEQEEPDSEFSTVGYPNPEDPNVFKLALELADKVNAEVIIATDPDADRIGAAIKDKSQGYIFLNGNMTGVLLTEYILSHFKEQGRLPADGAVISTIVSTNLTRVIANYYGMDYMEVLTGFKYIGEKIKDMDEAGKGTYLFGFEESYGYLAGTHARDKDAVCTAYLICEMAAAYKMRGMTLYDGLIEIYEKYGCYMEEVKSITLPGIEGTALMKKIMDSFRGSPPVSLGRDRVVKAIDFGAGEVKNLLSGQIEKTALPKSNVLYYDGENDSWMCIRPSGTEPKIKVYFGAYNKSVDECRDKLEEMVKEAMASFEDRKNAKG